MNFKVNNSANQRIQDNSQQLSNIQHVDELECSLLQDFYLQSKIQIIDQSLKKRAQQIEAQIRQSILSIIPTASSKQIKLVLQNKTDILKKSLKKRTFEELTKFIQTSSLIEDWNQICKEIQTFNKKSMAKEQKYSRLKQKIIEGLSQILKCNPQQFFESVVEGDLSKLEQQFSLQVFQQLQLFVQFSKELRAYRLSKEIASIQQGLLTKIVAIIPSANKQFLQLIYSDKLQQKIKTFKKKQATKLIQLMGDQVVKEYRVKRKSLQSISQGNQNQQIKDNQSKIQQFLLRIKQIFLAYTKQISIQQLVEYLNGNQSVIKKKMTAGSAKKLYQKIDYKKLQQQWKTITKKEEICQQTNKLQKLREELKGFFKQLGNKQLNQFLNRDFTYAEDQLLLQDYQNFQIVMQKFLNQQSEQAIPIKTQAQLALEQLIQDMKSRLDIDNQIIQLILNKDQQALKKKVKAKQSKLIKQYISTSQIYKKYMSIKQIKIQKNDQTDPLKQFIRKQVPQISDQEIQLILIGKFQPAEDLLTQQKFQQFVEKFKKLQQQTKKNKKNGESENQRNKYKSILFNKIKKELPDASNQVMQEILQKNYSHLGNLIGKKRKSLIAELQQSIQYKKYHQLNQGGSLQNSKQESMLKSIIVKYLPSAQKKLIQDALNDISILEDQLNQKQYQSLLNQSRLLISQCKKPQQDLKQKLYLEINKKLPNKLQIRDIDTILEGNIKQIKKNKLIKRQFEILQRIIADSSIYKKILDSKQKQLAIPQSLKKLLQGLARKQKNMQINEMINIFTQKKPVNISLAKAMSTKIDNYQPILQFYVKKFGQNKILSQYSQQIISKYKEVTYQELDLVQWLVQQDFKQRHPLLINLRKYQLSFDNQLISVLKNIQRKQNVKIPLNVFKAFVVREQFPVILQNLFQYFDSNKFKIQFQENYNTLQIKSICSIHLFQIQHLNKKLNNDQIKDFITAFDVQVFTLPIKKKQELIAFLANNKNFLTYKNLKNKLFLAQNIIARYKSDSEQTIIFILDNRQIIRSRNSSEQIQQLKQVMIEKDKKIFQLSFYQKIDFLNFKQHIFDLIFQQKLSWNQLPGLKIKCQRRQDLILNLLHKARQQNASVFCDRKFRLKHFTTAYQIIYMLGTPLKKIKNQKLIQEKYLIISQEGQICQNIILSQKEEGKTFITIELFPVNFKFKGQLLTIPINRILKIQSIRNLVTEYLKNQGKINGQLQINIFYLKEEAMIEIKDHQNLTSLSLRDISIFYLQRLITVKINFNSKVLQMQINQGKHVKDINQFISKQLKIQEDSQLLLMCNKNNKEIQLQSKMKIQSLISDEKAINICMIHKMNLKLYGLNKIPKQTIQNFKKIFIQNSKQLDLQRFTLREQEQQQFAIMIIDLVYVSIKKKFRIKHALSQIKQIVSQSTDQSIWWQATPNFTEDLIYNIILSKSQKQLRLQLIKSTKKLLSQPIYLPVFQSINDVTQSYILNEQLIWLSQPAINLVSLSVGDDPKQSPIVLLNTLFYCNFEVSKQKHYLAQLPQICLSVYDYYFPFNVTNIPFNFSRSLTDNILKIANIVLIQCFKPANPEQVLQKIKKMSLKAQMIIVLVRDTNTTVNRIKAAKDINFSQNPIYEMVRLENQPQQSVSRLRQKLFSEVQKCSNQTGGLKLLLKNKVFQQFDDILPLLNKDFSQLVVFNFKVYDLKLISRAMIYNQQLYKQKESEIRKLSIHPTLKRIFLYIESHEQYHLQLMTRLRQYITTIKEFRERPYQILDKLKDSIKKSQNTIITQDYRPMQRKLNQLRIVGTQTKLIGLDKQQALKQLFQLSKIFNNQIKPKFFSIQLAWRQLYFGSMYNQIDKQEIFQVLVKLKKKQIINAQPFQCLDGDNLEMAEQLIKTVFSTFSERIIVITVLGPQSSGKSTLLNSLFGCQFGTSQGRCTRGVYGTLYKFKNKRIADCDGIFLIDTQGIFSQMVQKDSQMRSGFDSKLILFCMAVSNVIIVNTRGQIDINTKDQLKKCFDKFQSLKEQGAVMPDRYLILNQNMTTNTSKYSSDIDSLTQMIERGNIKSLGIAFQTKNYTKRQIFLLSQDTQLAIKSPKENFRKSTNQLLQQIIDGLKKRSNYGKINDTINKFIKLWTTIDSFPNLFQSLSRQVLRTQDNIKSINNIKIQNLRLEIKDMIHNKQVKVNILKKIDQKIRGIKSEYAQKYDISKEKNQQLINIIRLQQCLLTTNLNHVLKQTEILISKLQVQGELQKIKRNGVDVINQKIKKIRYQISKGKRFSDEELVEQFQKSFKQTLDNFSKIINNRSDPYFICKQIKQIYQMIIKQEDTNSVGLVQSNFVLNEVQTYQTYLKGLIQKILAILGQDKLIQKKKVPPTKVLVKDSGKTDASLQYLDMRQYFSQQQIVYQLKISKTQLKKSLSYSKILSQYKHFKNNILYSNQPLIQKVHKSISNFYIAFGIKFSLNSFQQAIYSRETFYSFAYSKNIECQKNQRSKLLKQQLIKLIDQQKDFKFIDIKQLKKFIKENTYYLYDFSVKYLSQQFTKFIVWEQVKKQISAKSDRTNYLNWIQQFKQKLNYQIRNFGIEISEFELKNEAIYAQLNQTKVLQYKSQQQIAKQINSLYYFDIDIINSSKMKFKSQLKSTHQRNHSQFSLGKFIKKQLIPVRKQVQKELIIYSGNNFSQIDRALQSKTILNFILRQLKTNDSCNKFFIKILNFVKAKGGDLKRKNIQQIYMLVKQQINNLNNDLNQVSHRVTLLFNGYAHVFAVYAIWKHIFQNQKSKAQQPIKNLIQSKQELKENFLKKTNQDQIIRSKAQAQTFVKQIVKILTVQIQTKKKKQIQNYVLQSKKILDRQRIQEEIQRQCFSIKSTQEDAYDYLMNPKLVIDKRYAFHTDLQIKNLRNSQICRLHNDFSQAFIFIKDVVRDLYTLLQNQNFKAEECNLTKFIQIVSSKQSVINQEGIQLSQQAFFQYLTLILTNSPIKQFSIIQTQFKIKQNILSWNRESLFLVQYILDKICKSKVVKLNNLWHFLNFTSQYMKDQLKNLQKEADLNQQNQAYIRDQLKIIVCDQKCPGCGRICGVEGNHKKHKVIYGHQFRAISGVKFQNGDASVIKCQDLDPIQHQVKYNGKDMTYGQFIQYFQSKDPGGWDLSDIKHKVKESAQREELFNQAWQLAGKRICIKQQMKYVQLKKVKDQLSSALAQQPNHYIFAMDQSGSMSGKKWENLLKAFSNSILHLKTKNKAKVTVVLFQSTPRILQQNQLPSGINTALPFKSGGTCFTPVFQLFFTLSNKYIQNQTINLIFLTDGQAQFPKAPLQKLKTLQKNNPKKLRYSCIGFQASGPVMQQIRKQLNGTNDIVYGQGVISKMKEIIKRSE